MRISDWSSDVCSSDLMAAQQVTQSVPWRSTSSPQPRQRGGSTRSSTRCSGRSRRARTPGRSEEHTSELQSLMRISYAVFCLKKQTDCHEHLLESTYRSK